MDIFFMNKDKFQHNYSEDHTNFKNTNLISIETINKYLPKTIPKDSEKEISLG